MRQIIKKPVVSEKSFSDAALGKFTFLAEPLADKDTLRAVIEDLYKVNVEKINTQRITGKIKRSRGKQGKRNDYTKVTVTLKAGQKIALFDIETDDKEIKKEAKKADKADKKAKTEEKAPATTESKETDGVTTTIKKK